MKVVVVHFSAAWWGGCKGFKVKMTDAYKEVNKDGKIMEVIYLSGDKNQKTASE